MRFMSLPSVLLFLCASISTFAFNITQPRAGSIVDPSKKITITWTTSTNDPAFINLNLDDKDSSDEEARVIATNVSTAAGKYVVPANSIAISTSEAEAGFVIIANTLGNEGNAFLGESGTFRLASGGGNGTTGTASASTMSSTAAPSASSSGAAGPAECTIQWTSLTALVSILSIFIIG